jgi:hypothetical protein
MVGCARNPGRPVTREFDYLLAAVRQFFRPETRPPRAEGLDWREVMRLAESHSVMPLLYRACGNAELRDRIQEIARFSLTLSAELVKLLDVFEDQKIRVIPLKGPVLSAALYGEQALRTSADLDLLVRPGDLLRAKSLLEKAGYRMESVLHWPVGSACFRCRDSQLSFSDPTDRVSVDVHWRILPGYFPKSLDEADVWRNLRSVPWEGSKVWTLAPEHSLLFLCAHGTKHLWERLGWICDIARLLQVEPGIDWFEVFSHASRTHTSRMVYLGLLLASDLLGAELPLAVAERVTGDSRARALASIVTERLRAGNTASALDATRFSAHAFERTGQRVRFVFGIFVQPTEAEYCALQLPPGLHWLYYLFRPLRLAVKYSRLAGL